jgi:hypothetical protein
MMDEMKALLESVARECGNGHGNVQFTYDVLESRLFKLLESGRALYEHWDRCIASEIPAAKLERYRAAKLAAWEGRS